MEDKNMSLQGHLKELRRRLLVSGLAVLAFSVLTFAFFGDRLYEMLLAPLRAMDVPVIATRVTEAFLTKIKISFIGGFIIAFPVVAHQVLGFILPGLTRGEKRVVYVFLPLSVLLFGAGLAFAGLAVFPLALKFLLLVAGDTLAPMISVREYLSFVLAFFIPFGLVFQLPLATYLLAVAGMITPSFLARRRKYALLFILVLAAVLTPGPDVVTQLMMAGPMLVLYEVSIMIAWLVQKARLRRYREAELVS